MTAQEQLDGGSLKGVLLHAHLEWVRDIQGGASLERLAASLSEESARLVRKGVDRDGWYPFRAFVEIDRAIADMVDDPPERLYRALGRRSARENIHVTPAQGQSGDPHEFFRRDAVLQGNTVDFGRAVYERIGERACRIRLLQWTCFARPFCVSAEGFFARAVTLHGGTQPEVTQPKCLCHGDDACVFDIRWG